MIFIQAILKNVCGLDIHQKVILATIITEEEEGKLQKKTKEFLTFNHDLKKMAKWIAGHKVELVVMESTGIYCRSIYERLEEENLSSIVVNAKHMKNVPGKKTDVADSEWLAELARCGLLKASFIPTKDFRDLRLLTRYRIKTVRGLAAEKNRLNKILENIGIKLSSVMSSVDCVSGRRIIEALIDGQKTPKKMADLVHGSLKNKKKELILSLDSSLLDRHRFLLRKILNHIDFLNEQVKEMDEQIVLAMEKYREEWQLLQTIPGIDTLGAAMLLTETGTDMAKFGNSQRFSSWAGVCPSNNSSAGKKKPLM